MRSVGIAYIKELASRKDSDYEVNPSQMEKLVALVQFFRDCTKVLDGEVEPVKLKPVAESGYVTAYFPVFYLHSADVERFSDVIRSCSAISVDVTNRNDGEICISCTIPNVFVRKSRGN